MRITRTLAIFITASVIMTALTDVSFASISSQTAKILQKIKDQDSSLVAESSLNPNVTIPNNPTQGVQLKTSNQQLNIKLPNATHLTDKTPNGATIYSSSTTSNNIVIPTENGVQLLTTITCRTAPTQYAYHVTQSQGVKIKLARDGSAVVIDKHDRVTATVLAPWAKDARGKSVAMHFTTDGRTLTQHVADPRWIERQWWGIIVHLTNTETRQIGQQAQWLLLALGWAHWIIPAVIGSVGLWATGAADRGRCIALVLNTAIAWEEDC